MIEKNPEKSSAVSIPDDVFAKAYDAALAIAEKRAKACPWHRDELIDGATNAVLWARDNCKNADTFIPFTKAAVRRWLGRTMSRISRKHKTRGDTVALTFDVAATRTQAPVQPMLIEDLPEDLAFAVRLYMIDGYNLRDCGMLMGCSPNTVDLKLKQAAELLADGRLKKPERRKGEKRLTAG